MRNGNPALLPSRLLDTGFGPHVVSTPARHGDGGRTGVNAPGRMRLMTALALCGLGALWCAPACTADPLGVITTFATRFGASGPEAIAVGSGTSDRRQGQPHRARPPHGRTTAGLYRRRRQWQCRDPGHHRGSDGNLWYLDATGNAVGRITTAGATTLFTSGLSAGRRPHLDRGRSRRQSVVHGEQGEPHRAPQSFDRRRDRVLPGPSRGGRTTRHRRRTRWRAVVTESGVGNIGRITTGGRSLEFAIGGARPGASPPVRTAICGSTDGASPTIMRSHDVR